MSDQYNNRNIIVFGQTGAGKSSLINMLAGRTLAGVSNAAFGATATSTRYAIPGPDKITYTFWDTSGLNEDEKGTVPPLEAFRNLIDLAHEHKFHLAIYCIRASRFTEAVRFNYEIFWKIICDKRLQVVLVVTGLEQEDDMEGWWVKHRKDFERMGMKFEDRHACVTTIRGRKDIYKTEYEASQGKVWRLVRDCVPWGVDMQQDRRVVENRIEAYITEYNLRGNSMARRGFWGFVKRMWR